MKAFTSRMRLFLLIIVTLAVWTAVFQLPAFAAGTGTGVVTGILISILGSSVFQGAIITLIIAFLAWAIAKYTWVRHVINLGIEAYEYAESQGLLQNLKGYQKFDPFMDKFIEAYQLKFGTVPTPAAKGIAVKAMETQVEAEKVNTPGK